MSRNMVDTMEALFARLASEVETRGQAHAVTEPLDAERFILGNDLEQDALKNARLLEVERVPGHGVVALFKWRSQFVFSIPVSPVALGGSEDVTEPLDNAGLSSLLFVHDESNLVVPDPLELVNEIFGDKGGYAVGRVAKFFAPHRHFRTRSSLDSGVVVETWSRCQSVCARGIVAADSGSVWRSDLKVLFEQAASGSAAGVVGAGLLALSVASTPAHRYLEAYRCVEALFPVITIEDLLAKMPAEAATVSRSDLIDTLEDTLQWRLRQDTTLERLVARLPSADVEAIGADVGAEPGASAVAKKLFKARNRVAHGTLLSTKLAEAEAYLRAALRLVASAYGHISIPRAWFATDGGGSTLAKAADGGPPAAPASAGTPPPPPALTGAGDIGIKV